jgi:hypothetical protein
LHSKLSYSFTILFLPPSQLFLSPSFFLFFLAVYTESATEREIERGRESEIGRVRVEQRVRLREKRNRERERETKRDVEKKTRPPGGPIFRPTTVVGAEDAGDAISGGPGVVPAEPRRPVTQNPCNPSDHDPCNQQPARPESPDARSSMSGGLRRDFRRLGAALR